ncbi:MAG: hypothetical protein GY820_19965, partial [Gammaproteobacteria bacterium]|nr:hypothetical protein [Gammaproteobacteria bacterium]
YHQRVAQEQREWDYLNRPQQYQRGAYWWNRGQRPYWSQSRGRGRHFSPRGEQYWRGGRPFGRSPSPRGGQNWDWRGQRGRGWIQRGYRRGPPPESEPTRQEASYGEHGEYQQAEESEGSVTPTVTPTPESPVEGQSSTTKRSKKKKRGRFRDKKRGEASSAKALAEQEEDDDSEEAPIPITAEEVMQLGLNINPQQRSHLVSHSFIKKQVQLLMESEKLRQYRNLTEQERKRVQDQLDTLHGEMTTLIELQQR